MIKTNNTIEDYIGATITNSIGTSLKKNFEFSAEEYDDIKGGIYKRFYEKVSKKKTKSKELYDFALSAIESGKNDTKEYYSALAYFKKIIDTSCIKEVFKEKNIQIVYVKKD